MESMEVKGEVGEDGCKEVGLESTEVKVGGGENGGQEKGRRGAQGAGLESTESKDGGRGEHGCKG